MHICYTCIVLVVVGGEYYFILSIYPHALYVSNVCLHVSVRHSRCLCLSFFFSYSNRSRVEDEEKKWNSAVVHFCLQYTGFSHSNSNSQYTHIWVSFSPQLKTKYNKLDNCFIIFFFFVWDFSCNIFRFFLPFVFFGFARFREIKECTKLRLFHCENWKFAFSVDFEIKFDGRQIVYAFFVFAPVNKIDTTSFENKINSNDGDDHHTKSTTTILINWLKTTITTKAHIRKAIEIKSDKYEQSCLKNNKNPKDYGKWKLEKKKRSCFVSISIDYHAYVYTCISIYQSHTYKFEHMHLLACNTINQL